jgi:glutathione synthase/RimK-type ligase-like ATP-grasp enzyme
VRRVALATCAELPGLDDDDRLIAPALAMLGVRAVPAVWDDPAVDWGAFDLVVVRNTWDYPGRREDFLAWAAAAPRIANTPAALAWTTDKRYLGELAAAGLPVVPTAFAAPGEAPEPLLAGRGEVVVKPSVGVGSIGAQRFAAGEHAAAAAHARALQARGLVAMVQPYLRGVEDGRGETALIFLGGRLSHAICKGPLLGGPPAEAFADGLYLIERIEAREPTGAERAVGERVLSWITARLGALPYARIDVVPGAGGQPVVLEAELAEPSLFLGTSPGAPGRLAAALAAVLG